ncbi:MAG: hypothetical protein U5R49_10405 [Deltaproteobacteria bacterium]|nr:hypothetical protein [Deltaproteobacteria bacterium]
MAFDRGTTFDQGIEFDEGATPDKRAKFDEGAGFDGMGGFDRERSIRIREQRENAPVRFRAEEGFQFKEEDEKISLSKIQRGAREEALIENKGSREELPDTSGKKPLEQDLLQKEEVTLNTVRSVERGFLIKIAMFAVALLALLAGTLKGLIPFKFYFFLTILILILWNPMESFFISIIIGLSALLAPILG